jgi:Leucine rich repeat
MQLQLKFPIYSKIDLSENKITKIDVDAFKSNRDLQLLDVTKNNLKVLHFSTFTGLPKFEDLRISLNPIELPKNKPFLKCESLRRLTMDSCQLADIHPQTFSEVRNIQELSLNYNRIESVPVEAFKLNLKLKSLLFESNKLKFFPANIIDYLPAVSELCVDNNTFVDGQEFQKFRKKYVERSLRTVKCNSIGEFKIENLFLPETTTTTTVTSTTVAVHVERFFHAGISDFFMGSYISMILISQVVIFILLALYLIKLEKFGNFDGDECLADSFISDDPLHKIYRLDEE